MLFDCVLDFHRTHKGGKGWLHVYLWAVASGREGGNYRRKEKPSNLFMSSSPSKCLGRGEYRPGEMGGRLDLYSRVPLLPGEEIWFSIAGENAGETQRERVYVTDIGTITTNKSISCLSLLNFYKWTMNMLQLKKKSLTVCDIRRPIRVWEIDTSGFPDL